MYSKRKNVTSIFFSGTICNITKMMSYRDIVFYQTKYQNLFGFFVFLNFFFNN